MDSLKHLDRYELEYRGYWVEVYTRSRLGGAGREYAAEVRLTADPEEATRRHWTCLEGEPAGFAIEIDALEDGMRRGFAWVGAVGG
jgi:hypothetical protein